MEFRFFLNPSLLSIIGEKMSEFEDVYFESWRDKLAKAVFPDNSDIFYWHIFNIQNPGYWTTRYDDN